MGNYRFKLSDMIPNAWFYKLKDMGSGGGGGGKNQSDLKKKKKKQLTTPSQQDQQQLAKSSSYSAAAAESQRNLSLPRKSYYYTREFAQEDPKITENYSSCHYLPDPPRKSARKRTTKRKSFKSSSSPKPVSPSVSAGCRCRTTSNLHSFSPKPETSSRDISPDRNSVLAEFSPDHSNLACAIPCNCRVHPAVGEEEVIVSVDEIPSAREEEKCDGLDSISEIKLPPIITKPEKFDEMKNRAAGIEMDNRGSAAESDGKENRSSFTRRFSANPTPSGLRLRINSPRIGRKFQGNTIGRRSSVPGSARGRSISESFAIVKSSFDPKNDFKESMMEMIVLNKIRASEDLEELLACYLSLNSDEYHDLIIQVFKQIWFDLNDLKQRKVA
ncbi:hypothetical protein Nepgr_011855 [Nepenthes gracilis]|uniref:Transcription repressor n=1 Tax=Nepenthes gracilis TaxID=150966 RepID=A0AAD3SFW4_NEPGR|nr:hypothetical protein Nepgr_011855 [Nepenthes gracilis]